MDLETCIIQKNNKKIECLNRACKACRIDIVKAIVSSGNTYDYGSDTFYSACEGGNIEITKIIYALCKLSNGLKNMHELLYRGMAGACEYGNIDIITLYMNELRKYPNNLKDHMNLYINNACKSGNMELVDYLITICEQYKLCLFSSGLTGACIGGHFKIAKLMIEKGAHCESYMISHACKSGNIKIVELLLSQGAILIDKCLISACEGKNIEMVKFLVNEGLTNWGDGLSKACQVGCVEIMEFMIEKSREVHKIQCVIEHKKGCEMGLIETIKLICVKQPPAPTTPTPITPTPITPTEAEFWNKGLRGACLGGNIEIVKFIFQHIRNGRDGGSGSESAIYWNRCLEDACFGGSTEVVEFVIHNGAISSTDWNEGLIAACIIGNLEIIERMITMGANDWYSAAYRACYNKHFEIAKYMISKDLESLYNVNKLFVYACGEGLTEIAELLIKKGANDWLNSSYLASWRGYTECVKLILKYMKDMADSTEILVVCNKMLVMCMLCNSSEDVHYTYLRTIRLATETGTEIETIPHVPNNTDISIILIKQGADVNTENMFRMKLKDMLFNTDSFTLYCLCCKYGYFSLDVNKYNNLLRMHPPYILLVSCKAANTNTSIIKCHVNKLPVDLFRLLFTFC